MESSEQVQAETYPELVTDSELEEHDDEPVTTTSKDWIVSVLEAKYKKERSIFSPSISESMCGVNGRNFHHV